MVPGRLLSLAVQLLSFFVPSSLVFAFARWQLRVAGEMDAQESTTFALGVAGLFGFIGLVVVRRYGLAWMRLGPLKLRVRVGGLAVYIDDIEPWGACRVYQIGDLLIVNHEYDRVLLRMTIPAHFPAFTEYGSFVENAEPLAVCQQAEGRAFVVTSAGRLEHLPPQIDIERHGHARGHTELIVELGGRKADMTEAEIEKAMEHPGAESALDEIRIEDLISRRVLIVKPRESERI